MERDSFLSRVGQAARQAPLSPTPQTTTVPPADDVDLLELFTERATAVNARVHGPVSVAGAPRLVADIVSGHGCESLLAWDDLPAPGVAPRWVP